MSSTEWNGTHPVWGPAADAQGDRDTKQMVDAIVASLTARAAKAEAERDRLARVVSVMRGESEHLPEGWRVYLDSPPIYWARDSATVEVSVDPVSVGGVVMSYKLWASTIDENGDSDDTVMSTGTCPLASMEELDRSYPPAP
jgi:hypothetical protein